MNELPMMYPPDHERQDPADASLIVNATVDWDGFDSEAYFPA